MPVIRDLITDMDSVHWKKIRRVTPWLLPEGPPPEREYIVPKESMVDVTQTMACIQCGACVSDCLSMEVDPEFIGPAALAKAYRFVGDPRDGQHFERLRDLSEDPHGIYDCTHCFNCIEACPKGVAPMSQIMRLRRIAGADHHIVDENNGHRHEQAFVSLVKQGGLLHEAELLPRSYGGDSWFGKFHPRAGAELADSLPVITRAIRRGKVTPAGALAGHKITGHKELRRIFDTIEGRDERYELNLYIVQPDDDPAAGGDAQTETAGAAAHRAPGSSSAEDSRERSTEERLGMIAKHHLHPPKAGRTVKVAYWPGCVSRGFTPELHGSMAKVAPLLDIELVELDRASCCGAGVIAEHNQELADTLNARTFALAQQVQGADMMMNICSTCQGAQSERQQRLDANAEYREHVNATLEPDGLRYERGITNKHFLWLMVEEIGLDAVAAKVKRPLKNLRVGPFYGCYIVRPTRPPGHHRRAAAPTRTSRS